MKCPVSQIDKRGTTHIGDLETL